MDSFLKWLSVRVGKHTSVHDVHPHSKECIIYSALMEYIYGTIFPLKKIPINVSYACYKKIIQKLYKKEQHNIYTFLKLKTSIYSNPCYITEETCILYLYYIHLYYFIKYLSAMGFLVDFFFRIILDLEYFRCTRGVLVSK